MDLDKAIAYVQARGNTVERARLAAILWGEPPPEAALRAWLLRCLQDAGLSADHPLVARCLADLERKQRPDGSWGPEEGEGEEHAANATVAALRALRGNDRSDTDTAALHHR